MRHLPNFDDFRAGPGGRIAKSLGVPVDNCASWNDYTSSCSQVKEFAKAAQKRSETASSGEAVVLCALLHAADYDSLSDKIAGGLVWKKMGIVSGDYKTAVLACIARVDA